MITCRALCGIDTDLTVGTQEIGTGASDVDRVPVIACSEHRLGSETTMPAPIPVWKKILKQPGRFALQVLKAFQKNQGLLLSGALAYYILLSIIPLLTFLLLMLSHVVDEAALMTTLRRYIGLVIPGDSEAILGQIRNILEHREVAGWVVLGSMLFFSSLAFSVLESAMSIIFVHRVRHKSRPMLVSLLLPYLYILLLGIGFLLMTVIASLLQSISGNYHLDIIGDLTVFADLDRPALGGAHE
jgi:uncharacterized BrkB/YihY/UPF0761 family membrane protein